jgi:hypothetical protein
MRNEAMVKTREKCSSCPLQSREERERDGERKRKMNRERGRERQIDRAKERQIMHNAFPPRAVLLSR